MVASAVLGAATGTGLALLVAMTLVIYRYYSARRYGKDWGDIERFSPPKGWQPPAKHQPPKRTPSGYSVTPHKVFNIAKEEQAVQPSSPSAESCVPQLDITGGLKATLCRTPSATSYTSLDSGTKNMRSPRALSVESRSLSDASPLSTKRPVSPLLLPQDTQVPFVTTTMGNWREAPTSPLPLGSITPSIYLHTPLNLKASNSLGKLHFSVNYDYDRSDFHVHLIQGKDLEGEWSEPFVRVIIEPGVDSRVRQSTAQPRPNPVYDQHFKFPISQEELQDRVLILQVLDYDRYSRNDIVGKVTVVLKNIDVTSSVEIRADIEKIKKPVEDQQEILVSLSYLPSAERFTVVILKAKNLVAPEHRDSVDPFVKVYLVLNGKRVKKKKTACRKGCKNPVWNEAITFNLSSSALQHSAVEIVVRDQGSDLLGSPSDLGSVLIGNDQIGAPANHWSEMISSPRKAVAMWHTLL